MSKAEKENRINSLAVTFLERQQIIPHPFAERITSAYKEGYHQAEKDLELTWKDMSYIRFVFDAIEANIYLGAIKISPMTKEYYEEVLKRFKELKGE